MNAVEIESAVSDLARQPFHPAEFPYQFLAAFDNKELALKRLRKGNTNASDLPNAVLQHKKIHIAVAQPGQVPDTLLALRQSPKTTAAKAKFILATDGITLEAEDLTTGETIAPDYPNFADHFAFFLPLAGISTVKEIKDNPIDVRATGRLNKLYIELLKHNPDWSTDARRHDMNHFMARLIFCFFAESTGIFLGDNLFTGTIKQMTESDGQNTHEVIGQLFRSMNTKLADRAAAKIPPSADTFPYVNGGLFSGATDAPRFTRMARSFLLQAGDLRWREINPDIFGSMIQAVADDEERGALGMHYTSVPNILKVLNPLFLDDLRAELAAAGTNGRTLLNLRKRISKIRVFDPACGSGNFLVIAYKHMREIEAEINRRRGEPILRSEIPLTNFRGIELRDFPAEIARLALVIAQYQNDALYRGELIARAEFLPLDKENWITCGNALRLDWLSISPPTGSTVKLAADDLFSTPLDQAQIDFENQGGETYICGNPPYLGFAWQGAEQKVEIRELFNGRTSSSGFLDYVAGWFIKAAEYGTHTNAATAFVSTNSICQGQQVAILWPLIFETGHQITFAHTSFKWANLASNKAGVTVVIVGISAHPPRFRQLFSVTNDGSVLIKKAEQINAYLVNGQNVFVVSSDEVLGGMYKMDNGNKAVDGGHLLLEPSEVSGLGLTNQQHKKLIKRFVGSLEAINGTVRYCIWIGDDLYESASSIPAIRARFDLVRIERLASSKKMTRDTAARPYAFQQVRQCGDEVLIVVPRVSSENRDFLPVLLMEAGTIMSDKCFAFYNAPLWNMALIASRLHWVWIGTVCVRMRTDFSYSNTLGWNTFPVPPLTDQNKSDLTRCAENILLAREAHFPATIADLYDPDHLPENLRRAHEENDDILERIYIGRRFRNDTERLEKLFELYTKMTAAGSSTKKKATVRKTVG